MAQESVDLVSGTRTDASIASTERKSPAPPPASSSNWTGFYIGGYAGVGIGRASANTSTVFSSTGYFATTSVPAVAAAGTQRIKPRGFAGGGTIGYNHQSGNFVIGAEADFGSLNLKKTVASTATYPCCAPTNFTVTQSVKTRWLFTVRPRVGVTAGKALFYATGGLALTDLNYQALFTDTFATAHENGGFSKTKAGWTGGAGAEFKIGSRWSAKGEYLFTDFRRSSVTSTNLTAFSPSMPFASNTFTHSTDLKVHNVRFGINYHF